MECASPLQALEAAILMCLQKGMAEIHSFKHVSVRISFNTVRIECTCPKDCEEAFEKIVDECYICKIITLPKEITFFYEQ